MRQKCTVSIASIAGLLLLLNGAAQANEADDTIHRLAALAREQARAGHSERLVKTIDEIVNVLPDASPDGVLAVNELNRYLADPSGATPHQETSPAATPEASSPSPQPAEDSRALQQAVPANPPAVPPPERSSTPAPVATSKPAVQTPDGKLVDLLRRQGDNALSIGDISGARRYFRRGAEAGCGACAEALAQTYDAEQLRRMGVVGIKPDPSQAEIWRARARQLGWPSAP